MLVKQQQLSLLPTRETPVFDGDALQYRSFITAFEQGIECKVDNLQDKLFYLEQYTKGQPRQLVRSFLHIDPEPFKSQQRSSLNGILAMKLR